MAIVVSKGTIIKQTIASVLTAVAQVKSFGLDGMKSESFDSTTLDSGVGKRHSLTGYSEGGSVSMSLFYDPSLAGHKALLAPITTPAEGVWNMVTPDAAVTAFTTSEWGAGIKVDPGAGLMLDCSGKITGLPTFPV